MLRKKLIALLICLPLMFVTAYAAEEVEEFDYTAQLEASGADKLYDELPEETADYMRESGIDDVNYNSFTEINVATVINSVLSMTQNEIKSPFAVAGFMLAMLILASFIKGGENSLNSPLAPTVGTVMSVAISVTLIVPVIDLINEISQVVDAACTFTEAFSPVFIGILLANGQTATAAGYSSFLFGAVELSTICVGELIIPLLKIFLALSCVCAISTNVKIDAFIAFFEKNAKWLLGFLAVLLSGILGISGVISASADNVTARTAKFVISGSVPVVGGAVSDAYLTIKSGMTLLRNSVGAFGIIAMAYIYLPMIIRTVLWNLVLEIGLMVCEALQLDSINKLLKSVSGMVSLMLGLLVFSMFLLIVGSIVVIMQKSA